VLVAEHHGWQPRRRAAELAVDFCRQIKGSSDFLCAGSNCKIEQSLKDFGGIRHPSCHRLPEDRPRFLSCAPGCYSIAGPPFWRNYREQGEWGGITRLI
jgi:hypothetical protein